MRHYTQNELSKLTGLKNSQLDYLVREKIIPCIVYGKSILRKFPPEAIEIIKARLGKLQVKK